VTHLVDLLFKAIHTKIYITRQFIVKWTNTFWSEVIKYFYI